jgi:hypothetical protein
LAPVARPSAPQLTQTTTQAVDPADYLAVPDHSSKFWLTVQSLCPEAERAKQWLRRHEAELRVDLEEVLRSSEESRQRRRCI